MYIRGQGTAIFSEPLPVRTWQLVQGKLPYADELAALGYCPGGSALLAVEHINYQGADVADSCRDVYVSVYTRTTYKENEEFWESFIYTKFSVDRRRVFSSQETMPGPATGIPGPLWTAVCSAGIVLYCCIAIQRTGR